MWLNCKRINWILAPKDSILWITVPLVYTFFIQVLTGFPKADTLKNADVHTFWIQLSEGIFDYPYWLQDLSHFPLFFVFAWLWAWFIRRRTQNGANLFWTIFLSVFFAVANELTQFYIPQRFPSVGDIAMNLSGVSLALLVHCFCLKNLSLLNR